MSYTLTDNEIKMNCSQRIFNRGINYYKAGYVERVFFHDVSRTFKAVVKGTQKYNINIYFDENGNLDDAECDCPAFEKYSGDCKHIVAVLLHLKTSFEEKNMKIAAPKPVKTDDTFFEAFINDVSGTEKFPLKSEVYLNLQRTYHLLPNRHVADLHLRIGEDKVYNVRDLRSFIESFINKTPMVFTKNFTYNPNIHYFDDATHSLLSYIRDKYLDISFVSAIAYRYGDVKVIKGKFMHLNDNSLKKILKFLKGRTVYIEKPDERAKPAYITDEKFAINPKIDGNKDEIDFSFELENDFINITGDYSYIYSQNKIYNLKRSSSMTLSALIKNAETAYRKNYEFKGRENVLRFIRDIYPKIDLLGPTKMSITLESIIRKEDLSVSLYLDSIKNGISAKIVFNYSELKINPLKHADYEEHGKWILIRDAETEDNFIRQLKINGFKKHDNIMLLSDDGDIYDFVFNSLPELQKTVTVFYSDKFKNIKLKTPTISGSISISNDNLLDFDFKLDGIDTDEINEILKNISIKKKYYRLRDGSYLPLENEKLLEMKNIIDALELSAKDIKKGHASLPKYRALYLEDKLNRIKLPGIERDEKFSSFVNEIKNFEISKVSIPKSLDGILRHYQEDGFRWLRSLSDYSLGGILADDMGLGKTLQILTLILSDTERKMPAIIVVPTSLVYNWGAEIEKFTPELKYLTLTGTASNRKKLIKKCGRYDIVITSYPLIRKDIEFLRNLSFSYCVLDEAQYIKNPNSLTAKSVKDIAADKKLALTGTPVQNSLTELWSIFDFIMPGFLFSHHRFSNKYEKPIVKNGDLKLLEKLSRQISPFLLRRLKQDVLTELPEKIENHIITELDSHQKKVYLAYLENIRGQVYSNIEEKGFEKSRIDILAGLTRLRQICCHPALFIDNYKHGSGKLELLMELLEENFESGHKVLLFSQFTSMLSIIKKELEKRDVEYYYLDGSIGARDRLKMVNRFNEGNANVFLISLKAGGTGLNLTGANAVIHYDPWWNPAVEDQATDRAHRIGQKRAVHVMKLISKGTIEEKIYKLQQKKRKLVDDIIRPGETMLSKLSQDEIKSLFEID